MPFKSKAEQRFAYAHPDKFGGQAGLKEWSAATDFSKLPEKKKKKPSEPGSRALHAMTEGPNG